MESEFLSHSIHLHPFASKSSRLVDAGSTATALSVAVMEPKLNIMVPSPAIPLIKEDEEISKPTESFINQLPTVNEAIDILLQPTTAEEEISENWMQTAENVDKSIDTASTNLDAIGCNWMQLDAISLIPSPTVELRRRFHPG
jgi:hypothetical protein